jgi:bisanhydrobacterioruberin hydratase
VYFALKFYFYSKYTHFFDVEGLNLQKKALQIFKKYPFHVLFASMYLAGLIGLNIESVRAFFYFFTPIHLVSALAIVLYFHQDWSNSFKIYCISAFLIGFLIEVVGVNTGLVFGQYQYDTTLGFKVFGTPPVIGALWLLLSYCFGIFVEQFQISKSFKIVLAASLMTALDFITEPVAIRFKMWSWFGKQPPLQNYIGWFVVSLLIFSLFFNLDFKKENKIATWILLLNTLFFAGHYLLT